MTPAESYRKRAAELRALAVSAPSESLAAEWTTLAQSYTRLAEQAEQNAIATVWGEFGAEPKVPRK